MNASLTQSGRGRGLHPYPGPGFSVEGQSGIWAQTLPQMGPLLSLQHICSFKREDTHTDSFCVVRKVRPLGEREGLRGWGLSHEA